MPFLTEIINSSLSSGIVPFALKLSHIRPLLKKNKKQIWTKQQQQKENNLQNYRAVVNLMFTSQVLERIVATQIKTYLHDNNVFSDARSALLRVQNDLLLAVDEGQEAVLGLLDNSAAFETNDHEKFLKDRYGICRTVLKASQLDAFCPCNISLNSN